MFTIGGAQAVAALAYGTATIPKVDKIVGPGNAYVAAAKRRVFGVCGIDMIAGPSEILVICDGQTDPDWIAMDLFSQAEHDELAQAILLSPDAKFIEAVAASADKLLEQMPRRDIIRTALENRGALIHVADLDEACTISNRIAPEHLELSVANPEVWLPKLKHAGAIFMGRYTSEALGDYCAGPNHVLPTSGTARFSSPLGVYDFQKRSSLIQVSAAGRAKAGRHRIRAGIRRRVAGTRAIGAVQEKPGLAWLGHNRVPVPCLKILPRGGTAGSARPCRPCGCPPRFFPSALRRAAVLTACCPGSGANRNGACSRAR